MKKLVSIALGLLAFFGSAGIPLFQHTCTMEDVTIQTLFTSSDHCEEAPVEVETCCAAEETAAAETHEHVKQEPCCTDDVKRLALQFNFFEHWQLSAATLPNAPLSIASYLPYTAVFPREEQLLFAANSDPPPLTGRERLCSICILRL